MQQQARLPRDVEETQEQHCTLGSGQLLVKRTAAVGDFTLTEDWPERACQHRKIMHMCASASRRPPDIFGGELAPQLQRVQNVGQQG